MESALEHHLQQQGFSKEFLFLFSPGLPCSSGWEASTRLGISVSCKPLASPQWYCRNHHCPLNFASRNARFIWSSSWSKYSKGGATATDAELAAASPSFSEDDTDPTSQNLGGDGSSLHLKVQFFYATLLQTCGTSSKPNKRSGSSSKNNTVVPRNGNKVLQNL